MQLSLAALTRSERARPPEQREILSTWRIVCFFGLVGSVIGIPSDTAMMPAQYHQLTTMIRIGYVLIITAYILLSYFAAGTTLQYHTILMSGLLASLYFYLSWLDGNSGDFQRSAYHRAMTQVGCSLLVFRGMRPVWQALTTFGGISFYGVYVASSYGINPLGDDALADAYRYTMNDLVIFHLILFFVFRRYVRYQREEVQLREQLKRANEIKSEIIAKVNHELQVPLLGILANVDSMRRSADATDWRPRLDKIFHYSQYQRTLINNMIYAAASEAAEPFFVDRDDSCSLRACYEEAARLVADIHDGSIEAESPPDVDVPCQREILMIILVNLLANCAEHSTRTVIRWSRNEGQVVMFTESDAISPINADVVFDQWTTTRRDRTKPILGLGLNIVRGLVIKTGGSIEAGEEQRRFALKLALPAF